MLSPPIVMLFVVCVEFVFIAIFPPYVLLVDWVISDSIGLVCFSFIYSLVSQKVCLCIHVKACSSVGITLLTHLLGTAFGFGCTFKLIANWSSTLGFRITCKALYPTYQTLILVMEVFAQTQPLCSFSRVHSS